MTWFCRMLERFNEWAGGKIMPVALPPRDVKRPHGGIGPVQDPCDMMHPANPPDWE